MVCCAMQGRWTPARHPQSFPVHLKSVLVPVIGVVGMLIWQQESCSCVFVTATMRLRSNKIKYAAKHVHVVGSAVVI